MLLIPQRYLLQITLSESPRFSSSTKLVTPVCYGNARSPLTLQFIEQVNQVRPYSRTKDFFDLLHTKI